MSFAYRRNIIIPMSYEVKSAAKLFHDEKDRV